MLVCHPASEEYSHMVSPVTGGIRYMSTFFAYENEYYKLRNVELVDSWIRIE